MHYKIEFMKQVFPILVSPTMLLFLVIMLVDDEGAVVTVESSIPALGGGVGPGIAFM